MCGSLEVFSGPYPCHLGSISLPFALSQQQQGSTKDLSQSLSSVSTHPLGINRTRGLQRSPAQPAPPWTHYPSSSLHSSTSAMEG